MLTIRKMIKTCSACPAQWDAVTDDDRYVYIRYRFGFLSVDVEGESVYERQLNSDNPDPYCYHPKIPIYSFDGYLEYEELVAALEGVANMPAEESEWIGDEPWMPKFEP